MRFAAMLAGYAGFVYWAVRGLGPGGRKKEAALLVVMIACAAYMSFAWMRGWPAATPTAVLRKAIRPLAEWLNEAYRNLD